MVRETSMMALLAFWMPMHHGLAVAWTWRLVQIVAEIVTLAAVVLTGLPPTLKGLGAKGEVDTRRIRAIPTRLASAQGE